MIVTVTGRRLAVSAGVRLQVEKQMRRLERLLGDAALSAQAVLGRDGVEHTCEITLHARGDHRLHAKARHAVLRTAISGAAGKAGQQAMKLKDRWKGRRKGEARGARRQPVEAAPARPAPRIVRAAARSPKPLSVDDALLALDGSVDGLVVFRHVETDRVAIVYRRPDGRVGLVEPEV